MFRAYSRVVSPAASPRINPGVHDLTYHIKRSPAASNDFTFAFDHMPHRLR